MSDLKWRQSSETESGEASGSSGSGSSSAAWWEEASARSTLAAVATTGARGEVRYRRVARRAYLRAKGVPARGELRLGQRQETGSAAEESSSHLVLQNLEAGPQRSNKKVPHAGPQRSNKKVSHYSSSTLSRFCSNVAEAEILAATADAGPRLKHLHLNKHHFRWPWESGTGGDSEATETAKDARPPVPAAFRQ
ncbi:hypothetical protein ZEAMMB73_Zm00001d024266 [Zea mays]|uniref:Uncharacterized protein n=1 Tax=Zea mays TaxID=4577 RepID=A0A1D6IYF2_MAIZE|nr:hypothetical protein ZEAMMB73_Zm00001d024266 [Zea mays]